MDEAHNAYAHSIVSARVVLDAILPQDAEFNAHDAPEQARARRRRTERRTHPGTAERGQVRGVPRCLRCSVVCAFASMEIIASSAAVCVRVGGRELADRVQRPWWSQEKERAYSPHRPTPAKHARQRHSRQPAHWRVIAGWCRGAQCAFTLAFCSYQRSASLSTRRSCRSQCSFIMSALVSASSQIVLHPVVSHNLRILSTTNGRDKVRVSPCSPPYS
jgi:hypothetical protein